MIRKAIFLGANSRGVLPGVNYLWRKCPGSIIQEQSPREQLCVGGGGLGAGNGGNYPRGQLSGGQLSVGQFSLGVIILGGKCLGGNDPGGNHPVSNYPEGRLFVISSHYFSDELNSGIILWD